VLAVAAAVFWLGFDGGSYDAVARGSIGVALLWALTIGVGIGLWPLVQVPRGALVVGGLLAAYTAWIALSFLWGESAERTLTELNRASLYLACFSLAVLASSRASLAPWLGGLAVALSGVGLVALASRLFPDLVGETERLAQLFPETERRLSYPVSYWNGLATTIAFAFPLLLYLAVWSRSALVRGLALVPVPALAGTVYLTSSRGGTLAAALAALVFLCLSGRPWRAWSAALVAGAGSAVTVAVLQARSELVNDPFQSELAADQGRTAALVILLVCLAAGAIWAVSSRLEVRPPAVPRALRYVAAAVLIALVGAGIAAADPQERLERFKQLPPELNEASVEEHLFSGSGNGRWQLWGVAVDDFERDPLLGRGASTYEASWAQNGTLQLFVRDAHSLYLETLGELGSIGLVLLAGALVAIFAVGARRLLVALPPQRAAGAALLGVLAAYAFEAGFDWMWELTAVSAVAFLAAGLLVGRGTLPEAPPPERGGWFWRAAGVIGALLLLALQVPPLLSELKIRESREAAAQGAVEEAVEDARAARSLAPWSASPRLQLGLAEELTGDIPAARTSVAEALDRDPIDWRLWLVAARLETKAGDFDAAQESLARAAELNPRSRLFDDGA
jgi:O-antigen ligase